jgi:hypothetical protein
LHSSIQGRRLALLPPLILEDDVSTPVSSIFLSIKANDVQGVKDSGNPAKYGQKDVD